MKPTFEAPDFAYETALAFNFIASYAAPKFAVKFRINLNHTGAGQSLALLLHVLSRCYPHQLIVIGYKRVCKIMMSKRSQSVLYVCIIAMTFGRLADRHYGVLMHNK